MRRVDVRETSVVVISENLLNKDNGDVSEEKGFQHDEDASVVSIIQIP